MDLDGSNPKRLTTGSLDRWPQCSPDGKWVFYSGTSFGKPMVSKVSIEGGDSVRLTEKFMCCPSISPDGKLVASYYLDEQHPEAPGMIAIVSSEQGEIVRVLNSAADYDLISGWTADGSAVMYILTRDGVSNIYSQPLDGSQPKQVTDFNSDRIFQFAWSRDGKNLLCARGIETSDVVLISNFR
jgi:Tol biopolymer transport system component